MFVAIVLLTAIRLYYWVYFFQRIHRHKSNPEPASLPVSVIVCARNAASDLQELIPILIGQHYPEFEIIVVDDGSTDHTLDILKEFAGKIRSVSTESADGNKKEALTLGISHARNEVVLLTDADCRPGALWIQSMMNAKNGFDVVLGYSPMKKESGFVNEFSRFETLMTAIQYLSFAIAGKPYMGVGRNLMYTKSLFEKAGGFSTHEKLLSGDDDLFVQSVRNKAKIGVNIDAASFVYTRSKSNAASFFRQKFRHVSTAPRYDLMSKILLTGFAAAGPLWYGLLLTGLIGGMVVTPVLAYTVFLGIAARTYRPAFSVLGAEDMIPKFPVYDFMISIYYTVLAAVFPFTGRRAHW